MDSKSRREHSQVIELQLIKDQKVALFNNKTIIDPQVKHKFQVKITLKKYLLVLRLKQAKTRFHKVTKIYLIPKIVMAKFH